MCILLGDPAMTREWLTNVIEYKYNFNKQQIDDIISSTIFCKTAPTYLKCNKILFVDGCLIKMQNSGINIFADKIYTFKCSVFENVYNLKKYKNIKPLLDYRVYSDVNEQDVRIGIDYRKKILYNKFKTCGRVDSVGLLYLTKNCRSMSIDQVKSVLNSYSYKSYIVVTDDNNLTKINSTDVQVVYPPVQNLFDMFSDYIYTPTKMRWDGSPRFPVECVVHGKNLLYHDIDESYLEHDRGLFYRLKDIEQDFDSLELTTADPIVNII